MLEQANRLDDAAYHYGLVGEISIKAALVLATSMPLNRSYHKHLPSLGRVAQQNATALISLLANGRTGGAALLGDLRGRQLQGRFQGWSVDIRYADTSLCPVQPSQLQDWKQDAVALYNLGSF